MFISAGSNLYTEISANLDAYHYLFSARLEGAYLSDYYRATRFLSLLSILPYFLDRLINRQLCVM